jgi:hypothetical protein
MSSPKNRAVADLLSALGLALLVLNILASQEHGDIDTLGVALCVVRA